MRPTLSRRAWLLCGVAILAAAVLVVPLEPTADARGASRVVLVKYRSTPVDLAHPRFQHLNTARSSLVRGAWYDSAENYMIISLRGTYYHYCRLPPARWGDFRRARSFGRFYLARIKGLFDCRQGGVPAYEVRRRGRGRL